MRQQQWQIIGTSNPAWAIHRSQGYNAFGEIKTETDGLGRVTDLSYNTLGEVITKQDPSTTITLENGAQQSLRPTTRYYYDVSGRLVGTDDANNNRTSQSLLAGSGQDPQAGAQSTAEFHADGGIARSGIDIFGDIRSRTDELGNLTSYQYHKRGRLITVPHPVQYDSPLQSRHRYRLSGGGRG